MLIFVTCYVYVTDIMTLLFFQDLFDSPNGFHMMFYNLDLCELTDVLTYLALFLWLI